MERSVCSLYITLLFIYGGEKLLVLKPQYSLSTSLDVFLLISILFAALSSSTPVRHEAWLSAHLATKHVHDDRPAQLGECVFIFFSPVFHIYCLLP